MAFDTSDTVRRHLIVSLTVALSFSLDAVRAQPAQDPQGAALAVAAERQVGVTTIYDPSYRRLAYPGGDVPANRGVCSDVVIRSFRSIGVDLQVELHEDMKEHFRAYPQKWGLRGPDANIDHRRVPNLMAFFARRGKTMPTGAAYRPGDVVSWRLPGGLHHIGVISSRRTSSGKPLVVHNIGQGTQIEDILNRFEKLGHYRW